MQGAYFWFYSKQNWHLRLYFQHVWYDIPRSSIHPISCLQISRFIAYLLIEICIINMAEWTTITIFLLRVYKFFYSRSRFNIIYIGKDKIDILMILYWRCYADIDVGEANNLSYELAAASIPEFQCKAAALSKSKVMR